MKLSPTEQHTDPSAEPAPFPADAEEVVDQAELTDSGVRILVLAEPSGAYTWRLVPSDDGRSPEGPDASRVDSAVVELLRAQRRVPTRRGGVIEFRAGAIPEGGTRPRRFDRQPSSNSLTLVDISGTAYVHKKYRRISPSAREPELLRRLDHGGHTPRWAGDYRYVSPGGGAAYPLGVLYEHVTGEGLDSPLRENLRSLWPELRSSPFPKATVREGLRPLEGILREAGACLRRFHHDLATALGDDGPGDAYPVGSALETASRSLAALGRRPPVSEEIPVGLWDAALDALRAEADDLRLQHSEGVTFHVEGESGPCHGDLHLSHLIMGAGTHSRRPGSIRIIDVSTPSPSNPDWKLRSPLADRVALRRALEYFTTDEALDHGARLLGRDNTDAAVAAVLDAARRPHPEASWPEEDLAVLRTVCQVADVWRGRVTELLLGAPGDSGDEGRRSPLHRLLYLNRLLHELTYNQDHARLYHTAMDLRYALARVPGPSTTRM
ncbi:hypothetical protein GCM10007147_21570 [Nocardiopsis kunsanensis]|uniref:Uncharacterized protein n=1 Tax=Nocardiopsis kunsanensis TaxID=141693 RepID=A0A918XC41_9ACTN|nr:hypothetical protein [Nocardiopsis kunsanensis]GHD24892.1 hypothetical protein GCM10007147_21570 [Nocardiopsis kunsanensis]